jgi:hypothetical protein
MCIRGQRQLPPSMDFTLTPFTKQPPSRCAHMSCPCSLLAPLSSVGCLGTQLARRELGATRGASKFFFLGLVFFTGGHRNNGLPQNLGNTAYLPNEILQRNFEFNFFYTNTNRVCIQFSKCFILAWSGQYFALPPISSRGQTLGNAQKQFFHFS